MPIYAYLCSSCGLQKDMLQKLSDAPFTTCPECGKETFFKQLTSAGFQLKGSGYYATDFKNGNQPKTKISTEPKAESKTESKAESRTEPASPPCASPMADSAA